MNIKMTNILCAMCNLDRMSNVVLLIGTKIGFWYKFGIGNFTNSSVWEHKRQVTCFSNWTEVTRVFGTVSLSIEPSIKHLSPFRSELSLLVSSLPTRVQPHRLSHATFCSKIIVIKSSHHYSYNEFSVVQKKKK